jgi:transcriptional regulator with XRE-family HTH domain
MNNEVIRHTFANRLRELRRRSGYLTARSFARAVGEKGNTVTKWERGEVLPSIAEVVRALKVLDVSVGKLLEHGTFFLFDPKTTTPEEMHAAITGKLKKR